MARILVVDDESDLRELLRTVLAFDGHDTVEAADGEGALERLAANEVDLVLLDVMMPRRDGWWVLEQIKAAEAWADLPVVMLTARAADLDRIQGGIGGAVRYVTKPFSVAELRRTVVDVLGGPPEPEQRIRTQRQALVELARLEAGSGRASSTGGSRGSEAAGAAVGSGVGGGSVAGEGGAPGAPARPRLTRLDGQGRPLVTKREQRVATLSRQSLSRRQMDLLEAVLAARTIGEAAAAVAVSRSYLYASLGRIAEKAGASSGPDLLRKLRSGELVLV